MKKKLFLLAAVLTFAAWGAAPASATPDACNPHQCLFLINSCTSAGGTVISLNSVGSCTWQGEVYTSYTILCQVPPATFWDEVCFM